MQRVTFISEKPDEYPVILRPEFDQWYYSKKIWWWEPHVWGTEDLFSLIDKDAILSDLKNEGFLLVDFSWDATYIEVVERTHLRSVIEFFRFYNISFKKLIVLSSAFNSIYFTTSLGQKVTREYKHFYFNPFWFYTKKNYLKNNFVQEPKKIDKVYFTLMRKDSPPRRLVNYILHIKKIHRLGYVSHNRLLDNHNSTTDYEKVEDFWARYSTKKYANKEAFHKYGLKKHVLDDTLKEDRKIQNHFDLNFNLSGKTFLELIVETDNIDRLFISEKTMKSFLTKNIFMIFNSPRSLEYLNLLGFKTFNNIFDESYDTIEDDFDRICFICDELKRLSFWNYSELKKLYLDNVDITEHNYNHFLVNDWTFNLSNRIENYVSKTAVY